MKFEIEIIEGHDSSSYFWIRPVTIKLGEKIRDDDVTELEEEISIEEDDVESFLAYFFRKHFDNELIYNKRRYDDCEGFIDGFEWFLTYNFFTYEDIRAMAEDINKTAELLKTDYDDPSLAGVKKSFSIFGMCSREDKGYGDNSPENIRNHIDAVIDFYNRFSKRILQMLDNNPRTDIISIMGP